MFDLSIILAISISFLSISKMFYNLVSVFSKNKILKYSVASVVFVLLSIFIYCDAQYGLL